MDTYLNIMLSQLFNEKNVLMKNLLWCFVLIALATLFVQCKADEQNDEIENLVDNPNFRNPTGNPPGGNGPGNNGGNNGGQGNGNNNDNGGANPNDNGGNIGDGLEDANILDDRGLPLTITSPVDNDLTAAKVALGRLLFWDPVLSGELDVACATCHHPDLGYADGRRLPIGVGGEGLGLGRIDAVNDDIGLVQRNSPTIVNTAFNGITDQGNVNPDQAPMFWDNRARSLETQALLPLHSFEEMRGHAFGEDETLDVIIARLEAIAGYRNRFQQVFGGNNPITDENIGKAIAAFERTIIANNSPFDRYARGDENALTAQQIQGLNRFDAVGCADCHSGPMFSDFDLHVLGVPESPLLDFIDAGANDRFQFRTPTLRNLNTTGPYFHNGVAGNLNAVLNFYRTIQGNGGGNGPGNLDRNPNVAANQLDPDIRDLRLNNNDVQAIAAFLQSLNDETFDKQIPVQVPSGLPVGGNIQ